MTRDRKKKTTTHTNTLSRYNEWKHSARMLECNQVPKTKQQMCKYQRVNVIACLLASLYILVSAAVADFVMSPGGFHYLSFHCFACLIRCLSF